jgi:hypothetical protein
VLVFSFDRFEGGSFPIVGELGAIGRRVESRRRAILRSEGGGGRSMEGPSSSSGGVSDEFGIVATGWGLKIARRRSKVSQGTDRSW